jgi:hypothetical protein
MASDESALLILLAIGFGLPRTASDRFQLHLRSCNMSPHMGWPGMMLGHPTRASSVDALSKPQQSGYFFFSGSKPWRIEVRPR